MAKIINVGDTLVLENDMVCIVLKTLDHFDSSYALLKHISEDDILNGNIENTAEIIVEEIVEGEEVIVQPVVSESLTTLLKQEFKKIQ